jgi:outer membrane protein TolC
LQAGEDSARDRLAILTGQLPGDFSLPPPALDAFATPDNLPILLPSAYLTNRPDLRAARATVAAQNAALGLATAKLYPDVNISATGGLASETLGTLFEPSAALWTLAGNLVAPLYEGGTLHAQRDAAQAQLAAALAAYRQAVLTAFGQAADALDATQQDSTALTRAEASAQTANAAYQLANAEYRLGATDYTTVLTAEASAAQQALNVTSARVNLLADIARLQAVMAK